MTKDLVLQVYHLASDTTSFLVRAVTPPSPLGGPSLSWSEEEQETSSSSVAFFPATSRQVRHYSEYITSLYVPGNYFLTTTFNNAYISLLPLSQEMLKFSLYLLFSAPNDDPWSTSELCFQAALQLGPVTASPGWPGWARLCDSGRPSLSPLHPHSLVIHRAFTMGRGSGKIHPSFIIVSQKLLEDVVIVFVSCIQLCVCVCVTCIMDFMSCFKAACLI